jgi:hypothetical protein
MRTAGPLAYGIFPTLQGKAGENDVLWLGDEARVDELERQYESASPLLRLLLRNAYTLEGITAEEHEEARMLIETLPATDQVCVLCEKEGDGTRTIADTNLCRNHNQYSLEMRM